MKFLIGTGGGVSKEIQILHFFYCSKITSFLISFLYTFFLLSTRNYGTTLVPPLGLQMELKIFGTSCTTQCTTWYHLFEKSLEFCQDGTPLPQDTTSYRLVPPKVPFGTTWYHPRYHQLSWCYLVPPKVPHGITF